MKSMYFGFLAISTYVASVCANTPEATQGNHEAIQDSQYTDLVAVEEAIDEVAVEELADAEADSAIATSQSKKKRSAHATEEEATQPRGGGKSASKQSGKGQKETPKKGK
jgi:hypothetical protein